MDKTEEKETYELSCLTRAEDDFSAVKDVLAKHRISPSKEENPVKIKLAYPIKKENFAFFGIFCFETEPAAVADLKKDLELSGRVLRTLVLKKPALFGAPSSPPRPALKPKTPPSAPRTAEALSNEALEKTLEEILK